MLYTKTNPVGIDIQIQRAQIYLHDKLVTAFGSDISAYGRAYKNSDKGSVKPLAYISEGEYKELLTNDTIKGLHYFFIENDEATILSRTCMSDNEVDVIFIVDDLSKVKGSITHYADEEIKEQVKSYLRGFFEIVSVTKGEEALNGFDISKLNFIYPYFVFKIKVIIKEY